MVQGDPGRDRAAPGSPYDPAVATAWRVNPLAAVPVPDTGSAERHE